jgi:predicted metalloprotease with PDZ domain
LELVEELAGKELKTFFNDHIYGTIPVSYNQYFEYLGMSLVDTNAAKFQNFLGLTTKWEEGRLMIKALDKNYGAYQSGLNVNDEIIALDGYRVWTEYERILEQKKVGDTLDVVVSREGKLKDIALTITNDKKVDYRIMSLFSLDEKHQKLRDKWLPIGN